MKKTLIYIASGLILTFVVFKITSKIQKDKANIDMAVLKAENKFLQERSAGYEQSIFRISTLNKALQDTISQNKVIIQAERQKRRSDKLAYTNSLNSLSKLSNNEQMAKFLGNSYSVKQFGDSLHFITPIEPVKRANIVHIENESNKSQVLSLTRENNKLYENIGHLEHTVRNDSIVKDAFTGQLKVKDQIAQNITEQVKAENKRYKIEKRKRIVSQIIGVVELVVIGWLIVK
jgi:hypothetical protein